MKKLLLILFLFQNGIIFGMESKNNQVPNFGEKLDPASELNLLKENERIDYCIIDGQKKEIFYAWWYWSDNRRERKKIRVAKFWFNAEPALSTLQLLNDCLGPENFKKITVSISPSPPKNTPSDKPYGDKKSVSSERLIGARNYLKNNAFITYDHPEHGGVEGVKFWDSIKRSESCWR